MLHKRRHPRITDTSDLLASLRPPGLSSPFRAVLNLSEGGMLVAGSIGKVGEIAGFELAGPFFRYAGLALVTHHTHGATGVQFLSWQGQAGRPIRALIEHRSRQRQLASQRTSDHDQRVLNRVAGLLGADAAPTPRAWVRRRL